MNGLPSARASHAMVASPHRLATEAAVAVLRDGGSAADAIVCAAAMLAVLYPHMCSVGGDAFAILFDSSERRIVGLNGSGRSPAKASVRTIRKRGLDQMPLRGVLPITVPGVVDAWHELWRRSGRLPFRQLLAPAIDLARDGFPLTESVARAIAGNMAELRDLPFARVFAPAGPPRAGAVLRLPRLAATLERIADSPDSFYRGDLGAELARAVARAGGLLAREDLEAHHGEWVAPVSCRYRGVTVAEMPPNSAGVVPLVILRLAEAMDVADLELDDPARIDVLVRATRAAFALARPRITDPAYADSPVEELLSNATIDRLARDLRRGLDSHDHVSVRGDTVYICAVDTSGTACSFIQSVYFPFGSGFVAEDLGVLFQNRGAYFSLNPAHPNVLAPNKRTYHTLMPAMTLRDGTPSIVFGAMGADGQPQTQVQVLTGIVDAGLGVQAALDAPRWLAGRSLVGEPDTALAVEARFPAELDDVLRQRGHVVRRVEPWSELMGHAHAIRVTADGLEGGADHRSDGLASGF
jgi:gamma-glutamyltranspeptidase/glutathione hydrolase